MQSQTTTSVPGPTPDHIPPNLVRDVDFFALACPGEDPQHGWWRMQQTNPDIFWTPHNGGHWVVTRADLIEQVLNDYERFSNREIMIPRQENLFANLLYTDPPDHGPLRRVIMPALTKTALEKLEDEARQAATTTLDKLVPRGGCEFFSEFAQVLPIVVFLDMMGLPLEDRHKLLPLVETVVLGNDVAKRMNARMQLAGYVQVWIDRRVAEPGTDVISRIAHSQVGDRRITPEEISNMCVLLLFGGLDTVAAMISFIARDLALRPDLRKRLIEEPDIMPAAIEEFLRRHGLVNAAREVTHDVRFEGVDFKSGDLVQVPNCLHGLDDRRHDDPLMIDFDRTTPIRHASFGSGVHICPGGILARREIKVFLEEWLRRIPDFAIKDGTIPVTASGMVNGVKELHLVWDVPA